MNKKNRELLHMVLCKYWDVFPGTMPTHELPNQKLGGIHDIPLVEGAESVWKSM